MGIPAPSNRWRWGVTNWVLPLARMTTQPCTAATRSLTFLQLSDAPWNNKNKKNAWTNIALKVQALDCMQGYTISTSNLQNWFDQLMKQEVQQFLGTSSRYI